MQGQLPVSGHLAALSQQTLPAAATGASQGMLDDLPHAHSRSISDLLGSVTGRIHRGTLDDPSSSFEGPAFGMGQEPPGQFKTAPGQGLWQRPSAATSPHDLLHSSHGVLLGTPVRSGSEAFGASMLSQEHPPGLVSPGSLSRRSTWSQPAALLQLLARRASPDNSQFQGQPLAAPFSAPQPPALLPDPQQLQRHLLQDQSVPSTFQTASSRTQFMHSGMVPQLQAFPATPEELARAGSRDLGTLSRIGGRPSRHSASPSLRPSSRSQGQVSGQGLVPGELEARPASAQGPALPLRSLHLRATSLSQGLGDLLGGAPLSSSPTSSSASEAMLAWGPSMEQVYPTPLAWQLGETGQGVAGPAVLTQQAGRGAFYQPAPGQGWGPIGVPVPVLEGRPMSRGATSADSGPGVICTNMLG